MAKTKMLKVDADAHEHEHSLEVQLPFLQTVVPGFTFVPICLGAHRFGLAEEVGLAIAATIREQDSPVGIVASSDLNHYENQEETLRKDQIAIDQVLARDPAGLWSAVEQYDVSMCGFIPTTAMLVAANALGATVARLLKHATSGDVNRDYGHVVGYGAMVVG